MIIYLGLIAFLLIELVIIGYAISKRLMRIYEEIDRGVRVLECIRDDISAVDDKYFDISKRYRIRVNGSRRE